MARVHVLDAIGENSRIVFHVTVQAGNNAAGIAWATALKNSVVGGPKSILPTGDGTGGSISAAELTAIGNGTVIEAVRSLNIPATAQASAPAANAFLGALHDAMIVELTGPESTLAKKLNVFGYVLT